MKPPTVSKRSEREMQLEDTLADVAAGIRAWRDRKVAALTLDNDDELLVRWIEAGPARDVL